jgi:hypothetical protein
MARRLDGDVVGRRDRLGDPGPLPVRADPPSPTSLEAPQDGAKKRSAKPKRLSPGQKSAARVKQPQPRKPKPKLKASVTDTRISLKWPNRRDVQRWKVYAVDAHGRTLTRTTKEPNASFTRLSRADGPWRVTVRGLGPGSKTLCRWHRDGIQLARKKPRGSAKPRDVLSNSAAFSGRRPRVRLIR